MRRGALIGLAILAQASPVFAHAFLERASPPVGSEVAAAPPELSITFTEGVGPLFSTIEVHGASGATVSTGTPHRAPSNNRRLIVEMPKLPPGTYTVIWHVTSVDTHKTEGNYQFVEVHAASGGPSHRPRLLPRASSLAAPGRSPASDAPLSRPASAPQPRADPRPTDPNV